MTHHHLMQKSMPPPKPARDKPTHEIRFGTIRAAIWRNEGETGVRYNTQFARSYKDGEEWKSTDSFGREDLLTLAKIADCAHTWIFEQQQQEYERSKAANR
jgi:hypothetical protein